MAMKTIKYNMANLEVGVGLEAGGARALARLQMRSRIPMSGMHGSSATLSRLEFWKVPRQAASDQRTDFSARKAAPSKIDSFAFKELLKARKKCKGAQQRFEKSQEKYRQETLSSTDASSLKKARAEWDAARAALKTAEAAVKAAERKANAD